MERVYWHVLKCDKLARKLEALEGKDTNVTSNDTISRQAALAETVHMELFGRDFPVVPVGVLKALPPAQAEREKGKWIRITQGAIPEQYICPFCHRTVEAYGVEELLSIRYPYCHCGADMRGEQE